MSSPTNYTLLVGRVRVAGNDTATSNPAFGETPQGQNNGTNKVFRLLYPNPVTTSILLTYGAGVIRQAAGGSTFSVLDAASGYVQLATAPDSGTTQPFYFDYYFQWFPDADYQSMIDMATDELGGSAGVDPGENLYPALIKYALSHYWNRRASQYANLFASRASSAQNDPHAVAPNFAALAKQARAEGDALRKAAQTGYDANLQPASGTVTMMIDPITPRY